jgi:hypothetical protein
MKYGGTLGNGLLGPSEGKAELSLSERDRFQVPVSLYVGPDSQAWLWFTTPSGRPPAQAFREATPAIGIRVSGCFGDGRTFCTDKAVVIRWHVALSTSTFELLIISPLFVQLAARLDTKRLNVRYTLLNALFYGTDETQKEVDSQIRARRDRFRFKTSLFDWKATWLNSIEQEHLEALRSGLIPVLPTATIETEIEAQVPPEEHDFEAEAISRLISLGTGIATRWAARQVWQDSALVQEMFVRRTLTTTAEDKSRYDLLSNLEEPTLRKFLESCVTNYRAAERSLCLNTVTVYLEQARHEKNPELKLAALVLGLETLSYQWCLRDGLSAQQLDKMNLQNKLLRMRKQRFHFIEKGLLSDDLRKGLRNPLIHSGQIPMMTTEEKLDWADSLYDLSLRILFCELRYRGRYRDLTKGLATVFAPS